ncbi:MAG: enoyl-CoA hydratase-related protein [Marinobacter sp.]|uniref:enoyl-CoA hydratase-related protein n=1 Tax=Marinobacter sp. TaxID=50741 RepID=UPI0034A076FF
MEYEQQVTLTQDGVVATLTLRNPPRHEWSEAMLEQFHSHIVALGRDARCRCLIITSTEPGEGRGWFSAGLSPEVLAVQDPLKGANLGRLFSQAFSALRRFPGVTFAAITGDAHNEGVAVALNCDFRVCADTARFQFTAGSEGRLAYGGASQLLPRLIGESRAKRMMLLEETVNAQEALKLGLVDDVAEAGSVVNHTLNWAERVLRQSPRASRAAKQLIEHARMRPLETGFAAERDWLAQIIDSGDPAEAQKALEENRIPNWSNQD